MILRQKNILGYSVSDEPADRVAALICNELDGEFSRSCVFLNPHSIVLAERDPAFQKALKEASTVFCDGVGLALASRILNRERIHRVYGYEFFTALSQALSRRRRGRVFFLGGTDESIRELVEKYRREFPGIQHIEYYAPPFRVEFSDADISDMCTRIAAAGTDILWIGVGSPKQEKLLHGLMRCCDVRCAAAIGAVFDFYTDRIKHAPPWVRHLGLQWAHRLALEPSRLWRRTVISAPLFMSQVMKELIHVRRR